MEQRFKNYIDKRYGIYDNANKEFHYAITNKNKSWKEDSEKFHFINDHNAKRIKGAYKTEILEKVVI